MRFEFNSGLETKLSEQLCVLYGIFTLIRNVLPYVVMDGTWRQTITGDCYITGIVPGMQYTDVFCKQTVNVNVTIRGDMSVAKYDQENCYL